MTTRIGVMHSERPANAAFLQGAREEAIRLGFHPAQLVGGGKGYLEFVENSHLDGLIISGPRRDDSEELETLLSNREGFPVVLQGQLETPLPLNSVDVDNVSAAKEAVQHLVQGGYRRIAIITNAQPDHYAAGQDRLEGYKQALLEAGLYDEKYVKFGAFTPESGEEAMRELLRPKDEDIPPPEAVFVASDTVAFGGNGASAKGE